jgi:AcrR family transcriptional regulator
MDRLDVRVGRPPKEQAEALGDHVVAVADALFIEKGYGATSMATVSARARVGKQTLYRRFPDKAALFREVIRRRVDAMIMTPADGATGRDPLAELKKMGRAALDTVLDPEFVRLYRIIIAEALPFPELACAAADNWGSSFGDHCIDAIRQAQALGVCKPGDPETLAQCFLWSLIGEAFLKGLAGQERLNCEGDRDAHLETVWQVFLTGIATAG